jgi:hypothetical protein
LNIDSNTPTAEPLPRHHRPLQPSRQAIRALILLAATVGLGLVAATPPATAGGWAITSLDPVPELRAGQSVSIGFTVLQHGITPATLEEGVSITVVDSQSSAESVFDAASDGKPGHYVARVTFPAEGSYTWSVKPGWFRVQQLGSITVLPASAPRSEYRFPVAVRIGIPFVAALSALIGLRLFAAPRRSRHRSRQLDAATGQST